MTALDLLKYEKERKKLSNSELARFLEVPERTLYRWLETGSISNAWERIIKSKINP